ncbi:hypothetical protein [Nocardia sp. NPDC050435]|uniref:hypothetical protein n=1 Tax=Nocardia sp. NPDC050435 TaxID=3155040 RepID=UPI003400B6C8
MATHGDQVGSAREMCEGDEVDAMVWDHDQTLAVVGDLADDGAFPLTDTEDWDWGSIGIEVAERARKRLVEYGIRWDPDLEWMTGGRISVPSALSDAEVTAIWNLVSDEQRAWLGEIVEEARSGKPPTAGHRTNGWAWVNPSTD